jgi:hypothetical protein
MMPRRIKHSAANNSVDDQGKGYTIGSGRPPEHVSFARGRSGNRAGRPKANGLIATYSRDGAVALRRIPSSRE